MSPRPRKKPRPKWAPSIFQGSANRGFQIVVGEIPDEAEGKRGETGGFGGCSPGARVHSDVPPERKPERGYVPMFPRNGHIRQKPFYETSVKRPCRGAMWIFLPDFRVEFWKVNFERWISWGWIFLGASFLLEKIGSNNSTQEFGSKIRAPKIRFPEFGPPNSGFGGAKSPVQKFALDETALLSPLEKTFKRARKGVQKARGIWPLDKTRTTVWKPPSTDPWVFG